MPNTRVPAAVPGLPFEALRNRNIVSRRAMLRGSLAAGAVLAPVAVIASPAAAPAENPNLVAFGAELVEIVAALGAVNAERRAVALAWRDRWPLAPDLITFEGPRHFEDIERDIMGFPIVRPGEKRPRGVLRADELREDISALDYILQRSRSARRQAALRRDIAEHDEALNAVEIYRVECRGLALDSGMAALDERAADLNSRLGALCRAIEAAPACGLAGLRIKARAVMEGPLQLIAALALVETIAAGNLHAAHERAQEGPTA